MKNIFFCVFIFISSYAHAGCTVDEIVKMAKEGSGRKAINEQCESEVDDAPRCSYKRVVQLALAKKRAYTIEEECGLCDRPQCEVGNGAACSLGISAPPGIKEGDACFCATPMGPITGSVSCNN